MNNYGITETDEKKIDKIKNLLTDLNIANKEELVDSIEWLLDIIDDLKKEIDNREEENGELLCEVEDLKYEISDMICIDDYNGIADLDTFIFKLKLFDYDLYENKLKDFIEEYLKFYNDIPKQ